MYETGLDNLALAQRLHALGLRKTDLIIADTGNGGDLRIAEIRRGWASHPELRFNVTSAVKGPGSIKFGINKIKSCIFYLTESSKNGWNEYQEYKWALDADKLPTDVPEDKNNHIMDAIRYAELAKGSKY